MTYSYLKDKRCPLQCEPGVLTINITNSAAATDYPIYVPWKDVRLVYAYSVVTTAIDGTGDMAVKFECNAASGTSLGTMTVAASSALGTIDEWTEASTNTRLSYDDSGIDAVNIDIDGSSTGTGAIQMYLYFERIDRGV